MTHFPNIMLVGIQGSGKGTQSRKMVEAFWYTVFDTGAELRKISETNTELWKNIKKIIESGNYVPSEYIRDTIGSFIEANKWTPILFDGPIRSKEQDQIIRPMLGNCIVIHLQLEKETAIHRLLHRRIDPETGETFGPDFSENINPRTGNMLTTRKDDTKEAIEKRISWSLQESLPLLDTWENDGLKIFHIPADASVDTVFERISHILSSL